MKIIIYLLLSSLLFSCAGIGLPDSSDPYKKLQYVNYAMAQGRNLPAEGYILSAIEIFKERKDEVGLADAYIVYGQYYKFGHWCDSGNDLCIQGHISIPKSIEYFLKAKILFKKNKNNFGVARAYFGLASAYGIIGEHVKSCDYFEMSRISYLNGRGKEKPFPVNNLFKDFEDMVIAFKKKVCDV